MSAWQSFKQSKWYGHIKTGFVTTAFCGICYPPLGFFILASIVCTAGLGLVFWIPFWAIAGMIASSISRFFSSLTREKH